jgi:hypothetical protein
VFIVNCIFVPLDNSIINQLGQTGHNTKFCTIRDETEIIRWDKNKNIYRGLVPPVPAVPANYTIPAGSFSSDVRHMACASQKTKGAYGWITRDSRDSRDSRDKVSTDNLISVPLDNFLENLVGQSRHGQFYKGL